MTMQTPQRDHGGRGGHGGHRGPHGPHGHRDAAALGLTRATGTVKEIGEATFVLATERGDLTVTTNHDTNFHGLSRNQARELGYEDVAAINTFAGLKVGRRVGVIGERQDDTVIARGVHFPIPPSFE